MSRSKSKQRKRKRPRRKPAKRSLKKRSTSSSIWRRIWQFIVGIGIVIGIAVGIKMLFFERKESHILFEQPRFSEDVNEVSVSIGGIGVVYKRSELEKGPKEPRNFKGYKPIKMYIEDGRLYADLSVYAGAGLPPIRVEKDVVYGKPPQWDINFNDRALEIVTNQHKPIYQFVYKSPSQIVITGIFPLPNGLLLATESGSVLNPIGRNMFQLKRIFKYPSWKYPGQYNDE